MADFPQDLFYDVSHYLSSKDLAAARATCHAFRSHVSSLVSFICLNLDQRPLEWDQDLRAAIDAFPRVSQLFLQCSAGSAFQLHDLSSSIVAMLSARLQSLQLTAPNTAPFSWNLFHQLQGLDRLTTLMISGVAGPAQFDTSDNPFNGFPHLTRLHLRSCWPRVPIPALTTLKNLQELKFNCDLWVDNEVAALSNMTTLTSLHLEGAQMSHQVHCTTLETLAQLPRLQTLGLGTLRPAQAYSVIDNTPSTCSLSLVVEGDAAEALKVASRCQQATVHNLNLAVKGVLSDAFFQAVGKIVHLKSLTLSLRSYRRSAPDAVSLPPLNISPMSSLSKLETISLQSLGRGELQQFVLGAQAAQPLRSCPHLHTFAVDCLDAQTAGSLVQVLPHAMSLRTLSLGCVPRELTGTPGGDPVAANDAPNMDVNTQSVAILPLNTLPVCVEDVHIKVSDALVVDFSSASETHMVFPHLKSFSLAGWVVDCASVASIAVCMPHLQSLRLTQPDPRKQQAAAGQVEELLLQSSVCIDKLLTLPQLTAVHVEQQTAVLSYNALQQIRSHRMKHAVVQCRVQQCADELGVLMPPPVV